MPLLADALIVVLVASAPVAIERLRGLEHAAGDLSFMFVPHFAWWWSRPRWLGGWNPWILGGFPSNADPLVGHVHPLGLLWAAFPPLVASAVEGAAAPALAGLGMLAYLRAIGCGRAGSVVGALAFAAGGYVHAHAIHPEKLRSVLAIPWALAAIEAARGPRLVAALGAAVALVVAGGHPQTIAFALVLVAAYGFAFGAGRRAAVAAALGVGAAVPAVTWLPALELVARSQHAHTVIAGVDHMTAACAHTIVVPFGCGGGTGWLYGAALERFPGCGIVDCTSYPGMLVLLLVLAGLPALARTGRGRFWIAAGLAGLVLSTEWVERALPIPGLRAPSRALLWLDLACAAGAGLVAGGIARGAWRPRAGWIAALALGAVVAYAGTRGPVARRASLGSAAVLAASALALIRPTFAALAGVLAADLVLFGAALHAGAPAPEPAELRRAGALLARDGGATEAWGRAVAVPMMPDGMWAQVERVRALQGWNVLVPAAYVRLLAGDVTAPLGYDFAAAHDPLLIRPESHVLDLLRARAVVVRQGPAVQALAAPRFRPADAAPGRWRLFVNERARPVAWLVHRVRVVPDDEALRLVRGEAGGFDPGDEALAAGPLEAAPPTTPGEVRVVEYDDDLVALRARTDAPAVLVTSELAAPGWTAEVGGRAAPVHTVNAGFRAVALPAGEHDVVLRYRPARGRAGLAIGAVACGILLACALAGRRRFQPAAVA